MRNCSICVLVLAVLGPGCIRDGSDRSGLDGGPGSDAASVVPDGDSSLGVADSGDAVPYNPATGNAFDGPISLDDMRVLAVDSATLARGNAPCRGPASVRVVTVTDGDTIRVSGISEVLDERVRLVGIDTPEVGHNGDQSECYGDEAGVFTQQLRGRVVWLTFDAECRDTFERLLAYVHVGSGPGDMWQKQLLRRGYAEVLTVGSNRSLASIFEGDEQLARAAGLGRWSACQ